MAKIKGETLLAVLAGVAILFMIFNYSKTKSISGFTDSTLNGSAMNGQQPAMFASNQGSVNNRQSAPETARSLLPGDPNSSWQNNLGDDALKNVSMYGAGDLQGIIEPPKRLMNLTVRSDPEIPRSAVGPWNNSTIEKYPQVPFEIGSDCKL